MTALQTTLALAVTAVLLADGSVDWDATLGPLQDQVNDKVQETREIREDIFDILDSTTEAYVDETTLVGKVMSRREQKQRKSILALNPDADVDDVFSMAETQALRGKIQAFIDDNRTKTDETTGKVTKGLFQSRRGRNGGIQTTENAEYIEHLAADKKNKSSKL